MFDALSAIGSCNRGRRMSIKVKCPDCDFERDWGGDYYTAVTSAGGHNSSTGHDANVVIENKEPSSEG